MGQYYQDQNSKNDSHLYGTEVINDLRLPRINSPHGTPDTARYLAQDTPSVRNNYTSNYPTPINPITPRKINKRTKQNQNQINGVI